MPVKTMHEGAYHYFYDRCPQSDEKIVASGYCYRGSQELGLVYNSYTFNSVRMAYLDGSYYLDYSNQVNTIEQALIQRCFNSWKDRGFPVKDWRCSTSDFPARVKRTLNLRVKRSLECTDCECGVSDMRPLQSTCFSVIFVCVNMFQFLLT